MHNKLRDDLDILRRLFVLDIHLEAPSFIGKVGLKSCLLSIYPNQLIEAVILGLLRIFGVVWTRELWAGICPRLCPQSFRRSYCHIQCHTLCGTRRWNVWMCFSIAVIERRQQILSWLTLLTLTFFVLSVLLPIEPGQAWKYEVEAANTPFLLNAAWPHAQDGPTLSPWPSAYQEYNCRHFHEQLYHRQAWLTTPAWDEVWNVS